MGSPLVRRYAFMAGLPRTGTNALAAVLSQNPAMYLSPQSELAEQMLTIERTAQGCEDYQLGTMRSNHDALLAGALGAFYADNPADLIIDKSRRRGTPYLLNMLTRVTGEPPKVLCPVRPLAEVVASFVAKAQQNPDTNFIDRSMRSEEFMPMYRKPIDDARVDWLLSPGGMLDLSMLSVYAAHHPETRHHFHVFTYADLTSEPGKTLDGIYDFLGVDRFAHDFGAVPAVAETESGRLLGVPDFHAVRPTLAAASPDPASVLSDYGLERCALEDFWNS